MLNRIWPFFIIISVIYALFSGRIENLNNSIFESTANAVNLSITFLSTICLWNGIIKIAQKTTLIQNLTKIMKPLINFLFPELRQKEEIKQQISMNIIANVLGLGNAATPLGIKAMKTLQKENKKKDTVSNSMAMFILLNTASLQIIPTTVIAIRSSMGSKNPSRIIFAVWIATIAAAIVGIIVTKIFIKCSKNKLK